MIIPQTGTDFLYDTERLSFFNMMICSFDNSGTETVSLGSNLTFSTIRPGLGDKAFLVNAKYDEPLSITLQIGKNPCLDRERDYITSAEISAVLRWLGRRDGFHKLKIYQKGYEDIWFNGSFNNFRAIKIGGLVRGLEITFTADSPYGYSDPVELTFTTAAGKPVNITNFSYETGHLYPAVFTCKCLANGSLSITNFLENRSTVIRNCVKNETITLDGTHKTISTSVPSHNLSGDFNYEWFRLSNSYYDNVNPITTSIPCEIHIEYNPIRKVGIG